MSITTKERDTYQTNAPSIITFEGIVKSVGPPFCWKPLLVSSEDNLVRVFHNNSTVMNLQNLLKNSPGDIESSSF